MCVKHTPARVIHPIDHSTHNTEGTGERCKKQSKHRGGQAQTPSPRTKGSTTCHGGCGAENVSQREVLS